MLDFIPELVEGGVVLNAVNCSPNHGVDCRYCPELAIGIHNWLLASELRYLIVDFQDENDICSTIITELLQLRKRLRIPFLFAGLMARPRAVLESYAYSGYPFFVTPEEAVMYLQKHHAPLMEVDLAKITFGEPIPCAHTRHARSDDLGVPEEAVEAEL